MTTYVFLILRCLTEGFPLSTHDTRVTHLATSEALSPTRVAVVGYVSAVECCLRGQRALAVGLCARATQL